MWKTIGFRLVLATLLCATALTWGTVTANPTRGDEPNLKAEFLKLCDGNAQALDKQATDRVLHAWGCFNAYVVRALAVAYDMERKEEYLLACKRWSDQTIEFQNRMIPKGAYYMHYGRAPGEDKGIWYVADCSSIAMGVLATAIRCDDPAEKAKYMDSVKSFFRLVADNWVRPSGGVANGHWPKSDKEYWCATSTFGSLAFCLYKETGDPEYLKIGLGTIDWLNRQNFLAVAHDYYKKGDIEPTVMMYCLEAYSAGLPHLKPDSERHKAALAQLAKAHRWILDNMGLSSDGKYLSQWGSKWGGLPFHLYVYAGQMTGNEKLVAATDKELRHIAGILENAPSTSKLAAFAIISYAEKIAPGGIYRTSRERKTR